MKSLLLAALSLMSLSAFAQNGTRIEQRIEQRLQRLNELVLTERAHLSLTEDKKQIVLKSVNEAIQMIRLETQPLPNPYPNPNQSFSPASCVWYDGVSSGIAQRGYHAVRIIRGIHLSVGYYQNSTWLSQENCHKDLIFNIDREEYTQQVRKAAATTCACVWYDGQSNGIATRGYHMSYRVRLLDGKEATLSSGYFDNASNASLQRCNQDLVKNNFVCPIR